MGKEKQWINMPIRMVSGWASEWCVLCAVLDDDGNIVEFNDSEDILWFRHLREPFSIDAGWYRDRFVVHFLDEKPSDMITWDQAVCATREVQTAEEMIALVEQWMVKPPDEAY